MPNPTESPNDDLEQSWTVLVADDDEMVHVVTELVLRDLTFDGMPVRLASARSAAQTRSYLEDHPEVAVLLLDVVMETHSAGLDLIHDIRNDLGLLNLRIVVRTGQAGYHEPSSVIEEFDVNGFARKEALKHQDLRDVVILGLRCFRDIRRAAGLAR